MANPTDPLFSQQWHFPLIGDIQTIWDEYTGQGVNVGIYDDGVQSSHQDLNDNYDSSLHVVDDNGQSVSGDPNLANNDSHGTAVAGIIGAEANNGEGGVGVAYGASLTGVNIFDANTYGYINSGTTAGFFEFLDVLGQASQFDVISNSWGSTPLFLDSQNLNLPSQSLFIAEYEDVLATGRGGLGSIIVQAAGNDTLDANGSGTNASRTTITVAATDASGSAASYSNFGSSILITAPAASVTTDLLGNDGYNASGTTDGDPTSDTDFTAVFGGTSAATPVVSGIVALMLEANPDLGWRDVKNILANSASHTGSDLGSQASGNEVGAWTVNSADNWNGGGYTISGSYGYGMVDVFASVRNAEAWQYLFDGAETSANEISALSQTATFSGGLSIPDNNVDGVTFNISSLVDVDIEHVSLHLEFSHTWLGDLTIYITDPDGTEYQVLFQASGGVGISNEHTGTWTFGIEGLRGVDSQGTWTVRVVDDQGADTGSIQSAQLEFFGSANDTDDVYHYTADIFDYIAHDSSRLNLADTNGGEDWINLAPITDDLVVDLASDGTGGLTSSTQGAQLGNIANGSIFENVVTGDGDDTITGNASDNEIRAMRGDDTLIGGAGADLLDGGAGTDVADYSSSSQGVNIGLNGAAGTGGDAQGDRLIAIENLFGSAHNDTLSGSSAANIINGGAGNDTIDGGAGSDTINGGAGNDRIIYDAADNAANVNGGADTDTLVVIDQAIPTSFNLAAQLFEFLEHVQNDLTSTQIWDKTTNLYNAAGQRLSERLDYDDGSARITEFDVNDSNSWNTLTRQFNSDGVLSEVTFNNDDTSVIRTLYDLENLQTWNSQTIYVDTPDNETWDSIYYSYDENGDTIDTIRYEDDGSVIQTQNDLAGTRVWDSRTIYVDNPDVETWETIYYHYDENGDTTDTIRYEDDGTVIQTQNDLAGVQVWDSRTIYADNADLQAWDSIYYQYDENGQLFDFTRYDDDGTIIRTQYDLDDVNTWHSRATYTDGGDLHGWESITYEYDMDGNLLNVTQVDDPMM